MRCMFPRGMPFTINFVLYARGSGELVTSGVPTCVISKDGSVQTPATNPAVYIEGEWRLILTAEERTAKQTNVFVTLTGAFPRHFMIVSDND